ncbi:uncharacterized protein L199_007789 [Kwoniella botswanensis]|uniref:uncharacterized protein n=1 Tax=Kwoniella botswanensis TaxID=1268659 RepID=UPI00315DFA54
MTSSLPQTGQYDITIDAPSPLPPEIPARVYDILTTLRLTLVIRLSKDLHPLNTESSLYVLRREKVPGDGVRWAWAERQPNTYSHADSRTLDDYESLDILRYADVSPEDVQVLIANSSNNVEWYSKGRRTEGEPAGSVLFPIVREMHFSCPAQEDHRQVLTLAMSPFSPTLSSSPINSPWNTEHTTDPTVLPAVSAFPYYPGKHTQPSRSTIFTKHDGALGNLMIEQFLNYLTQELFPRS